MNGPALIRARVGGIEVLAARPMRPNGRPPVLFVHGAFAHASMWAEYFFAHFTQAGYAVAALSLRGHGGSDGRDEVDRFGIHDYVDDVITVVEHLGVAPVLIGHSMGGFVVQKYLERHPAPAAVLMSSVPPQGLVAATFHMALAHPGLFMDFNRLLASGDIPLEAARAALFATEVPDEVLRRHLAQMNPESQRAIWDMSMFNLVSLSAVHRTPLMVLGTEEDRLMPAFLVQSTARAYGVPDHLFRGLGHGFPLEVGGERVALAVVGWLDGVLAGG